MVFWDMWILCVLLLTLDTLFMDRIQRSMVHNLYSFLKNQDHFQFVEDRGHTSILLPFCSRVGFLKSISQKLLSFPTLFVNILWPVVSFKFNCSVIILRVNWRPPNPWFDHHCHKLLMLTVFESLDHLYWFPCALDTFSSPYV